MQLELVYITCVCNFQRVFIRRMCCTVWNVVTVALLTYQIIRLQTCLVDSSETNGILIGVKQKKIIIRNKKTYFITPAFACGGRPMSRRETTTKISSYIILMHALTVSLLPPLSFRCTFDDRKRVI